MESLRYVTIIYIDETLPCIETLRKMIRNTEIQPEDGLLVVRKAHLTHYEEKGTLERGTKDIRQ